LGKPFHRQVRIPALRFVVFEENHPIGRYGSLPYGG
jgi:hypothetical protein